MALGKYLTICIVVILVVSILLMVMPSNAQTIPKPAVPDFTLTLADHSYDVPAKTTSTTDPYTGKTTTYTYPAYHVQNLTIDITFRNQHYPSTINGYPSVLYYDIAIKPHFTQDWYGAYDKGWFPAQINSEYTTISFPMDAYPSEGQLDFRAQTYLGYHYSYVDNSHIQPIFESSFNSSASEWSGAKTISLADSSISVATSPTPNPTPTPTVPEFHITASLVGVLAVITLLLVIGKRKLT